MVGGMATPHQVPESGLGRFPDDRFGMFVHWGPYSLMGADGWGMFGESYSIDEYEKVAARFEAAAFDAGTFVRVRLELS
jgi:alpha-L-fucosidase